MFVQALRTFAKPLFYVHFIIVWAFVGVVDYYAASSTRYRPHNRFRNAFKAIVLTI